MSDFTNSGERVEGASGLSIFFRSLRPKQEPRAVVLIVPGALTPIVAITRGWTNNSLQQA
jgi:alpha-beta hydrolase superfamily lysophospholipase